MKEIGGYIELDRYSLPMLHDDAIALNCGRSCLEYVIKSRNIRKILLPYFLCDSVTKVCEKSGVQVSYYHIDMNFRISCVELKDDEWLYIVNFYGQLSNEELSEYERKYGRIIVDNAQAYFQPPVDNIDTLYTCRKFFGVADGAFLYTNQSLCCEFPVDESFKRMNFLLGRYERTASEFYQEYVKNNALFSSEPIKQMSLLTKNLLHALDYEKTKQIRTINYKYLHNALKDINKLNLIIPDGAFMYPLYIDNGAEIRKKLQQKKIYIPTLWPYVFEICDKNDIEYRMAENILPIPVDQRYDENDMEYIISIISELI